MTAIPGRAVGARVARLRKEAGLTQKALARSAGISQGWVSQIEGGDGRMTEALERVARVLGTPLAELVAGPACRCCDDTPPAGFICRECGADGGPR